MNIKFKYIRRAVGISVSLSAIMFGCQIGNDPIHDSGSHVSDFSEAKDCGMVTSIGESSPNVGVDGKVSRSPSPLTITAQIIACGSVSANSDENWHAIGVGVERRTIMIEDRKSGTNIEAQPVLERDGSISLYANNAVVMKLGSVPLAEIGMPIGLESGVTLQIRAGSLKVELTSAKSIPIENMTLWVVK